MLLDAGADPTALDGDGKTPADLAREKGYYAIARLIEKSRAWWIDAPTLTGIPRAPGRETSGRETQSFIQRVLVDK